MAHPWHLKSGMCQAVRFPACRACFVLSMWMFGCEGGPCLFQWLRGLPLHSFRQHLCYSCMASQALAERGEQRREGERFRGTCMAANLLHMEEMAFPCKMCFPSCVSPALMMMNLSMPPSFVSASSLLSPPGRETAPEIRGGTHSHPFSPYFNTFSCYFQSPFLSFFIGTDWKVCENYYLPKADIEYQVIDLKQNIMSNAKDVEITFWNFQWNTSLLPRPDWYFILHWLNVVLRP